MQRHGTTLTLDESLLLPFFGPDGHKKLSYREFKQFLNVCTTGSRTLALLVVSFAFSCLRLGEVGGRQMVRPSINR